MTHQTFPKPPPRKPKRRRPIRAVSQKRLDEKPTHDPIRDAVFERDGFCLLHPSRPLNKDGRDWGPCFGDPFTPHHLHKSSGCGEYTEENLVTLCAGHNDMVEDWPIEAERIGLVVRPSAGETLPVMVMSDPLGWSLAEGIEFWGVVNV